MFFRKRYSLAFFVVRFFIGLGLSNATLTASAVSVEQLTGEVTSQLRRDVGISITQPIDHLNRWDGLVLSAALGGITVYVGEGYIDSISGSTAKLRLTHGNVQVGMQLRMSVYPSEYSLEKRGIKKYRFDSEIPFSNMRLHDIEKLAWQYVDAINRGDEIFVIENSTGGILLEMEEVFAKHSLASLVEKAGYKVTDIKMNCYKCNLFRCETLFFINTQPKNENFPKEFYFVFEHSVSEEIIRVKNFENGLEGERRKEYMDYGPICVK